MINFHSSPGNLLDMVVFKFTTASNQPGILLIWRRSCDITFWILSRFLTWLGSSLSKGGQRNYTLFPKADIEVLISSPPGLFYLRAGHREILWLPSESTSIIRPFSPQRGFAYALEGGTWHREANRNLSGQPCWIHHQCINRHACAMKSPEKTLKDRISEIFQMAECVEVLGGWHTQRGHYPMPCPVQIFCILCDILNNKLVNLSSIFPQFWEPL